MSDESEHGVTKAHIGLIFAVIIPVAAGVYGATEVQRSELRDLMSDRVTETREYCDKSFSDVTVAIDAQRQAMAHLREEMNAAIQRNLARALTCEDMLRACLLDPRP